MATAPDIFPVCLNQVLLSEGGFVDDKDDPGGATNLGVTQFTYDAYRRRTKQTPQSVRLITRAEAGSIYRDSYWAALHCSTFAFPMAFILFDTCVQWGAHGTIELLMECPMMAGVKVEDALVVAATKPASLLAGQLYSRRAAFRLARVAKKPTQLKFLLGWQRRDRSALAFCLSRK